MGFWNGDPHTETKHLWLLPIGVIAVGVGFLALQDDEPLPPAERYESSYADGRTKYSCLDGTPYDPSTVLVRPLPNGDIEVDPIVGDAESLRFIDQDQSQPLQPADTHTASLLDDNECITRYGS